MINRVVVLATAVALATTASIVTSVAVGLLPPLAIANLLLVALACVWFRWTSNHGANRITQSVESAEREIRCDVVLTAITSRRRSARD